MKDVLRIGTGVILLMIVAGCTGNDAPKEEAYVEKVTNVEYITVNPVQFEENITLPIVVLPSREVNLGITTGGKVTAILVDKGDRVKKGQVLLETDDVICLAQFELAQASLEFQEHEYERNEKLYHEGTISEANFDAARLALAQVKSSYAMAKKNYNETRLKAPFGGTVTMRNVEVGDILAPGSPAFRIIDMGTVKIQAGIPEKFINDFNEGNKVFITLDALPGRVFEGIINFIGPEANTQVRTFPAEMVVENRDGSIRAGVLGNARILRNIHEDALMIPFNAMIETEKGTRIFVLKDGDVVEERAVETFGGNDLMMRVSGIAPGERVITKGHYDIVDGEKVNVTGEYRVSGEEEDVQ